MSEEFHAIRGSKPNYYTEEFLECIKVGCPNNALLKILTNCTLVGDSETDVTLFTVREELLKERQLSPTDTVLLDLQRSGKYEVVLSLLEKRVAITNALTLYDLGRAYMPHKPPLMNN